METFERQMKSLRSAFGNRGCNWNGRGEPADLMFRSRAFKKSLRSTIRQNSKEGNSPLRTFESEALSLKKTKIIC